MPAIYHIFPVAASAVKVFAAISTAHGLKQWWAENAQADERAGGLYALSFGAGYAWQARAVQFEMPVAFELKMTVADKDWTGSRLGFSLAENGDVSTEVAFYHEGWPADNHHYRVSSFCWAMYLRLLKRYVEKGETVPYKERLSV